MIKKLLFWISISTLLILSSCNEDENNKGGNIDVPVIKHETFNYLTYVGNIDSEFKKGVDEIFTNVTSAPDPNVRVAILGSINEIDPAVLQQIYENGTEIAIVNPSASELNAFMKANDWMDSFDTGNLSDAALICFNNNNDIHTIGGSNTVSDEDKYAIDDEPNGDPEYDPSDMDSYGEPDCTPEHSEYYSVIAAWTHSLTEKFIQQEMDGDVVDDQDVFFNICSINQSEKIELKDKRIRKTGTYIDTCSGEGSFTLTYNYSKVHVFGNKANSGDYYLMSMLATVNNSDMWDGKVRSQNHDGAVTRICGWLMKRFEVRTTLVDSINENNIKPVNNLVFAPGTKPLPSTEVHKGTNSIGQTYTLGTEASITGGWDQTDGANVSATAKVSAGWEWKQEQTYEVGECTIGELSSGSRVGWKAVLSNFPVWQNHKFILPQSNVLLTSNVDLQGTWIWKEPYPYAKDNTLAGKYLLKCEVEIEYFAISRLYSKTVETKPFIINKTIYLSLGDPIVRKTAGAIEIENGADFGKYISNIEIFNPDSGEIYETDLASYKTGEKINLGCLYSDTNTQYSIRFKARKSASDPQTEYVYINSATNNRIPIIVGKKITLHSNADFEEQINQ